MTLGFCLWCGVETWISVKLADERGICYDCWTTGWADGGAEKYVEDLEAFREYKESLDG